MEIEGFIVETNSGTTSVIVGQHLFEFANDEVLDVVDLIVPEGVKVAGNVRPARIRLVERASILNVDPLEPSTHALAFGQLPFSLAVRKAPVQVLDSPTYRTLERSFRQAHDL